MAQFVKPKVKNISITQCIDNKWDINKIKEELQLHALLNNGITFELIEKRFKNKSLDKVQELKERQKRISKQERENTIQAEIDLSEHLLTIRNRVSLKGSSDTKNIRNNRKRAEVRNRIDLIDAVSNT